MIATLRGEIIQIEESAVTVEVGGVGLRVFVPAPLRSRLKVGEAALLYTHLVVREDALTLYGFETQADRELYLARLVPRLWWLGQNRHSRVFVGDTLPEIFDKVLQSAGWKVKDDYQLVLKGGPGVGFLALDHVAHHAAHLP